MLMIYGIKNCDTMKKAMTWLNDNNISFNFHDYKKAGLDDALLASWLHTLGWEALINQKGTTWRKLALDKNTLTNDSAFLIIKDNLSLIKRPLVVSNASILLGFQPDKWQTQFHK